MICMNYNDNYNIGLKTIYVYINRLVKENESF